MAGTPKIRFGTGTTVKDFSAYGEWLRVAEDSGYELLTTGDSQSLWADPFVSMTVAASRTKRPRLAITVSNPMTRHPAVVASSATALQQLSRDRFVYGISSGDSALRNIGVRPSTVDELEEYVTCVQAMCDGRPATYHGAGAAAALGPPPDPGLDGRRGPAHVAAGRSDRPGRGAFQQPDLRGDGAQSRPHPDRCDRLRDARWTTSRSGAWPTSCRRRPRPRASGRSARCWRGRPTTSSGSLWRARDCRTSWSRRVRGAEAALRLLAPRVAGDRRAQRRPRRRARPDAFLARQSTIAGPIEHCVERLHEVAAGRRHRIIVAQFVPDQLNFMRTFASKVLPAFAADA